MFQLLTKSALRQAACALTTMSRPSTAWLDALTLSSSNRSPRRPADAGIADALLTHRRNSGLAFAVARNRAPAGLGLPVEWYVHSLIVDRVMRRRITAT